MTARWLEGVRVSGCGALPKGIEQRLMRASKIKDERERHRAIDRAYAWSTDNFPHLFRD